jgi:hypothetical protein
MSSSVVRIHAVEPNFPLLITLGQNKDRRPNPLISGSNPNWVSPFASSPDGPGLNNTATVRFRIAELWGGPYTLPTRPRCWETFADCSSARNLEAISGIRGDQLSSQALRCFSAPARDILSRRQGEAMTALGCEFDSAR